MVQVYCSSCRNEVDGNVKAHKFEFLKAMIDYVVQRGIVKVHSVRIYKQAMLHKYNDHV